MELKIYIVKKKRSYGEQEMCVEVEETACTKKNSMVLTLFERKMNWEI